MSPTTTLVTLLHEKLHLWMWDSGASPLDEEEEEDICDALSVALLAETLAGP